MNRLEIRIDSIRPNYPQVRLLIDGDDVLASTGSTEGNDPALILDAGALIPTDPPRRIAFYGCGCGEFGCSNVAGLILREGDVIRWTDFRSLTGSYAAALPEPEDGPDPAAADDWDLPPDRLALPTLTFDADEYLAVVRDAAGDRSWETRTRAVVRHLRSLRSDWAGWAAEGDAISVPHRRNRVVWSTDLTVPSGPPVAVAESLIDLLDRGVDPRRIAAENLWR